MATVAIFSYSCFSLLFLGLIVTAHNSTDLCNSGQFCNETCIKGSEGCDFSECCKLVQFGLAHGCGQACNQTLSPQSCQEECKKASQNAITSLIGILGNIEPPQPLATQVKDYSLTVVFEKRAFLKIQELLPYLKPKLVLLAKRIPDYANEPETEYFETQFEDLSEDSAESFQWEVTLLRPYTRYQFKVSFVISQHFKGFETQPSLTIRTKPGGAPSRPILYKIEQINNLHINITWSPPELPAGLIGSYGLHINSSKPDNFSVVKDLDIKTLRNLTKDPKNKPVYSYITGPLEYATSYWVSIFAISQTGVVGMSSNSTIQTPEPIVDTNGTPDLYFTQGATLYKKSLNDFAIYDPNEVIHKFNNSIISLDCHVSKGLIYAVDNLGAVFKHDINQESFERLLFAPKDTYAVSMDWMNDEAYFLSNQGGSTLIHTCHTDETKCEKLNWFINSGDVSHFKVDPYHGFAFWIQDETQLMQLELGCDDEPATRMQVLLDMGHKLGDFVVLFDQFKLQIADLSENNLLELDISSTTSASIKNVRKEGYNGRDRFFNLVKDMFYYKDILFWSRSSNGLTSEALHAGHGYFTSTLDSNIAFETMTFAYQPNQPMPMPLNSVDNINVLFDISNGQQTINIQWDEPQLLPQLGCGAWNQWKYDLILNDQTYQGLNSTQFSTQVNFNASHAVTIVATSPSGKGPNSDTIEVISWPDKVLDGRIHLLQPHHVTTLDLSGQLVGDHFLPKQAYGLVVGYGRSLIFNFDDSIESLAFEPLAQAMYSHVPKEQIIARNLTWCPNCKVDMFHIKGAKQFKINSVLAKACWIEYFKSVKCSSLVVGNGAEVVFQTDKFSESHVYGIAMTSSHSLYILVQDLYKATLHELDLVSSFTKTVKILEQKLSSVNGKLDCEYGKCLWIDRNYLHILDVIGKSESKVPVPPEVVDFALDVLDIPNKPNNVIPSSPEDVYLNGAILAWDPVSLNNVTYDLQLMINGYTTTIEDVNQTQLNISSLIYELSPFTRIDIKLQAQTPWAKSRNPLFKAVFLPMSYPSEPRSFKTFAEPAEPQIFLAKDTLVKYTLSWKKPSEVNGPLLNYVLQVNCADGSVCLRYDDISGQLTQFEFNSTLQVSQLALHAVNSDDFQGPSALFKLQSKTWPLPAVLVSSKNGLEVVDMLTWDTSMTLPLLAANYDLVSFSANEQKLYLRRLGETHIQVFDMAKRRHISDIPLTEATGSELFFDPTGQHFYWFKEKKIFRQSAWKGDEAHFLIEADEAVAQIIIEPTNNRNIFYATRNGKIGAFVMDYQGLVVSQEMDLIGSRCPLESPVIPELAIDKQIIYFVIAETKKLWGFDVKTQSCMVVESVPFGQEIKNLIKINDAFFWINSTSGFLWSQDGPLLEKDIQRAVHFCPSCQTLPESQKACLMVESPNISVAFTTSTEIGLTMQNLRQDEDCYVDMPPTHFTVKYKLTKALSFKEEKSFDVAGTALNATIDSLTPYESYDLEIDAVTSLGNYSGFPLTLQVSTLEGPPSPPQNIQAFTLTPTSILVSWEPSEQANGVSVTYEVHYQTQTVIDVKSSLGNVRKNKMAPLSLVLQELEPSKDYTIWVVAKTQSVQATPSNSVKVRTYDAPNLIAVTGKSPRSVSLSWKAPSEDLIHSHQVILESYNSTVIRVPKEPQLTQINQAYHFQADDLQPGASYVIRMAVSYKSSIPGENFAWPKDNRLTVTTPPDKPLTPGQPYLLEDSSHYFKILITWKPSDDSATLYELQSQYVNATFSQGNWSTVYSDIPHQWPITGLDSEGMVQFRVRAKNDFGWSDWSQESGSIDLTTVMNNPLNQSSIGALVGGSVAGLALICVLLILFVITITRKTSEKKTLLAGLQTSPTSDHELAVLRSPNLGITGTLVNNTIYEMSMDEDLLQLPKIEMSQITLGKFIGSGAFGEVYEGIASGFDSEVHKVAIKTLKKRESSVEFLKEAKAAASLKHDNIVQFMGVCLGYNYIILELMEGGDLLTYLKDARQDLTVWDLVEISHDVAKGCAYLEQMHFVHRDLAARNCMLTSKSPTERKVKIGDFGLARDVYKSDYYRGGGYLPMKWMSPESMMEHHFSTQSDVWSFGVLIWEIMTLGHRPYQEMSNSEVRHFVCQQRGHLHVPILCPPPLGEQLLRCWAYRAEERPSFSKLLTTITELLVFKEELKSKVCFKFDPSVLSTNGSSRDTWKTFGLTSTTRSQATTIACNQISSSTSLPLPPEAGTLQYVWPRNPCCDVSNDCSSICSAPAATTMQSYLRLLPKTAENSAEMNFDQLGYVSPRPDSVIQCGCLALSSQYQNLTDHSCPSTGTN